MSIPTLLCPTCAGTLDKEASVDAHRVQLHCPNGHRYHYFVKAVDYASSVEASTVSPPDFASDVECLRFWLSDARHVLGDPLAELAAGILRSYEGPPLPEEASKIQQCPLCGSVLSAFDDGDVWVQAMRCAEGHEWGGRGPMIATTAPPAVRLFRELTDAELRRGVAEYLRAHQPLLDAMLPESVRAVFDRFLQGRPHSRMGT